MHSKYHMEPSNYRIERIRNALGELETFDAKPMLLMLHGKDFDSFVADLRAAGAVSKNEYAHAMLVGRVRFSGVDILNDQLDTGVLYGGTTIQHIPAGGDA